MHAILLHEYLRYWKEMRAVTAAAKSREAFAAKEVVALKAKIEDIEKRLAFHRSGVAGGMWTCMPPKKTPIMQKEEERKQRPAKDL